MKLLVFLFPILLSLVFLCMKLVMPETYLLLIQEDAALENAQVIFYFLSAVLSAVISIQFTKMKLSLYAVIYAVLAAGLFLVLLEEISWGQRIFNITGPAFFTEHNTQNEITFHNLEGVQPFLHKFYILAGGYGAFASLFARYFMPRETPRLNTIVSFVVPDWFISPYFFFVFFIYMLFEYIAEPYAGGFLLWRDQEPMELLLSLGFLAFTVSTLIRSRQLAPLLMDRQYKRLELETSQND